MGLRSKELAIYLVRQVFCLYFYMKEDCGYFGAERHPRIDSCRLRRLAYVYWACNIVMASAVLITFAATIFTILYVHMRHYKALKKRCREHSCKIESARTSAAQA